MARPGKAADLRAAKERKQKKIAIVGGVLLVAILAFQVPRTMKMLGGEEPPAEEPTAVATTAPSAPAGGPVSLEPPTLAGSAGTAAPTGGGGELGSSELAPLAASGQLISFNRFESKDPFAQQLSDDPAASQGEPGKPGKPGKPPGAQQPPGAQAPPSPPSVALAAVISVNGTQETVAPGGSFPAATPLFTLVSLTRTSAAIAIAGGSYADGAKTVKLERGKSLTLMNTADGVRYELKLISLIGG